MNDLPDDLPEAFEYLDELRESGATNMYGARPYVMREMGYDSDVAGEVLRAWMETFSNTVPADERAFSLLAKKDS